MTNHRHPGPLAPEGHDFEAPHCPNRECPYYEPRPGWSWARAGTWARSDGTRFQAFRCRECRRYFSIRTFAGSYWLKRRDLLERIAAGAAEGPGLRQQARTLGVAHATVQRHLARIGRAALLFQAGVTRELEVAEPLVVDGFAAFEHSQYYPFDLNLAVGAESWFLYGFTDSPLRRSGRMTDAQKRRRDELETLHGRPDPRATEKGMAALLRLVLRRERGRPEPRTLVIHSDDHRSYPPALRALEWEGLRFEHRVTSAKERRTKRNPLFPANLSDLLLRHGQANHRRETIAYSKRRQGALGRCAIFMFCRNFVRSRLENRPGESPGMRVGAVQRLLGWRDLLQSRLFPRAGLLAEPWEDYYHGRVRTAALAGREREHNLRYAF
jgi:hypothetical protein